MALTAQAERMQRPRKPSFYAGLYLRTKTQIRFWGWGDWGWTDSAWGKREWGSASPAEAGQSRSALADWLRMAHSLLDTKAVESPLPSDVPCGPATGDHPQ